MAAPVHRFRLPDPPPAHRPRRPHHPPPYNVAGCSEVGRGQVEVDPGLFLEPPPSPPPPVHKLRCGMWASFALATVFVGGFKLCFKKQWGGLEVVDWSVVVAGIGLVVLLYACAWFNLSVCRRKSESRPLPPPAPPPPPPETPPPPYHIAVDLPHAVTPPPSYDKAVS